MIGGERAQNITFLVELISQLAVGRIQLKQDEGTVGTALLHMDIAGRFFSIVTGGSNACCGQFIPFVSTDMELSGEDD